MEEYGEMTMDTTGTSSPIRLIRIIILLYEIIMASTIIIGIIELKLIKLNKKSSNVLLKIINIILALLMGIIPGAALLDNYKTYSISEFGTVLSMLLPSILLIVKTFTKNDTIRKTINIILITASVIILAILVHYSMRFWTTSTE